MATDVKIINLHLAKPFYDRMKERADARGSTVTGYIRAALATYLDAEDPDLNDLVDAYLACDAERRAWLLESASVARDATSAGKARR